MDDKQNDSFNEEKINQEESTHPNESIPYGDGVEDSISDPKNADATRSARYDRKNLKDDGFRLFSKEGMKALKTFSFSGSFIIVLLMSLFFIGGASTVLTDVVKPTLCQSCHKTLTVSQTLMESSHAKFSCTTCHKSTNIFASFRKSQAVASASELDTITPIKRDVCEQCHTMDNRKVSPSTSIRIPHMKILAKGVQCVECHVGVAHGQKDTRGSGVVTFTGPRMPTCIKCHIERNLPTNCSFCHTDEKKPKSHEDEAWVKEGMHGQMAKKDVGVCQMCHAFTKDRAVNMGAEGMEAASFARSNKFCSNCHMNNRPATHTEIWPIVHKAQAIPNMGKCLTCHDREQPQPDERAVQRIYCNKCHAQEKHPSDWRKVHPSVVKSIGIVEGKCFNCHASTHCAKCHKANNIRQLKPEDLQKKDE